VVSVVDCLEVSWVYLEMWSNRLLVHMDLLESTSMTSDKFGPTGRGEKCTSMDCSKSVLL
jgi:hypothetical protein